ncbi:hypothetical protein ACQ4PT_037143 [Festuca glaucescens]
MAGGAEGKPKPLEFTPTWIVASICSVIIVISLLFERLLHRLGKRLMRSRKKPLYEALLRVKEELMVLGFISLLLTVFQGAMGRLCIRRSVMRHLLPCKPPPLDGAAENAHFGDAVFTGVLGGTRRLLAGGAISGDYCINKGKVPVLSAEAIHQLHIFIFVLAVTHFILSAITVLLGVAQKHCTPNFNFYNYMIRALEVDFKKVVGVSWYLWAMLMIFLLLNVQGWYVYIWISTAPFLMLLVVGSKMEHIITELAYEVSYGFKSCIMANPAYAIARIVISIVSQLLCGYVTLPLYAIVSHMGSSFKKAIFDDNVTEGLANWAERARRRTIISSKTTVNVSDPPIDEANDAAIQMTNTRAISSDEQGTSLT